MRGGCLDFADKSLPEAVTITNYVAHSLNIRDELINLVPKQNLIENLMAYIDRARRAEDGPFARFVDKSRIRGRSKCSF